MQKYKVRSICFIRSPLFLLSVPFDVFSRILVLKDRKEEAEQQRHFQLLMKEARFLSKGNLCRMTLQKDNFCFEWRIVC